MKSLAVAVVLISCCFTSVLLGDSKPYTYSKELTTETYELALKSHRIVFVKFYTNWWDDLSWDKKTDNNFSFFLLQRCKFSQRFSPIWEELAENYKRDKRILFADIDCETERICADVFQVSKYPSLYMFWNGDKFEERYSGYRNVDDLTDYIEETIADIATKY